MEKIISFINKIQEAPYQVRVVYHRVSLVGVGFLLLLLSFNIIVGQINQTIKNGQNFAKNAANNINLSPLNSLKEDAGTLKNSAASIFEGLKKQKNESDYFEILNNGDKDVLNSENNLNQNDSVLEKINRLPVEEY